MVTREDLIQALEQLPSRPFTVRLTDGQDIRVERFGQFATDKVAWGAKDARTGREYHRLPHARIDRIDQDPVPRS